MGRRCHRRCKCDAGEVPIRGKYDAAALRTAYERAYAAVVGSRPKAVERRAAGSSLVSRTGVPFRGESAAARAAADGSALGSAPSAQHQPIPSAQGASVVPRYLSASHEAHIDRGVPEWVAPPPHRQGGSKSGGVEYLSSSNAVHTGEACDVFVEVYSN
eukprot:Hpha_TRINITY_DN16302_c1_g7::TRINITY_DN16302_c1_g7_i2::g.60449::m.60449